MTFPLLAQIRIWVEVEICMGAHTTHTLKWPRLPQKWRRFYER